MAAKLFGRLAWLSARGIRFDNLLAKLRRIWRFGFAVATYLESLRLNDKVSVKLGQLQLQCEGQKVLTRLQPGRTQLLPRGP